MPLKELRIRGWPLGVPSETMEWLRLQRDNGSKNHRQVWNTMKICGGWYCEQAFVQCGRAGDKKHCSLFCSYRVPNWVSLAPLIVIATLDKLLKFWAMFFLVLQIISLPKTETIFHVSLTSSPTLIVLEVCILELVIFITFLWPAWCEDCHISLWQCCPGQSEEGISIIRFWPNSLSQCQASSGSMELQGPLWPAPHVFLPCKQWHEIGEGCRL